MSSVANDFKPGKKHLFYIIRTGLYNKVNEHQQLLAGRLLDFGCGSKPYKPLFKNVTEYIGVDYQSEGHSHVTESIDFFYDGKTLPFPDNSFDSVFSSEVLEHIFNPEEIFKEINRVMKPGGKILITCPFVWNEHEVPVDYARYTRFALQHLFEKNNFKIIKVDKAGDFLSVLHQLRIIYFSETFLPKLPIFLQKWSKAIVILWLNVWLGFKRKIFPTSMDLYLNNIVIAEKK